MASILIFRVRSVFPGGKTFFYWQIVQFTGSQNGQAQKTNLFGAISNVYRAHGERPNFRQRTRAARLWSKLFDEEMERALRQAQQMRIGTDTNSRRMAQGEFSPFITLYVCVCLFVSQWEYVHVCVCTCVRALRSVWVSRYVVKSNGWGEGGRQSDYWRQMNDAQIFVDCSA